MVLKRPYEISITASLDLHAAADSSQGDIPKNTLPSFFFFFNRSFLVDAAGLSSPWSRSKNPLLAVCISIRSKAPLQWPITRNKLIPSLNFFSRWNFYKLLTVFSKVAGFFFPQMEALDPWPNTSTCCSPKYCSFCDHFHFGLMLAAIGHPNHPEFFMNVIPEFIGELPSKIQDFKRNV